MRVDIRIPTAVKPRIIDDVKKRLARGYGGYTVYRTRGGWVNDDGELIDEPVVVIEIYHDGEKERLKADMRDLARYVKDGTGEDSIMYVIDGEAYFYNG